jgi:hypothetical protein
MQNINVACDHWSAVEHGGKTTHGNELNLVPMQHSQNLTEVNAGHEPPEPTAATRPNSAQSTTARKACGAATRGFA